MNIMKQYGADDGFYREASACPDMEIARVLSQHKSGYTLITEAGERPAEISGKFRYEYRQLSEQPAVGDFVLIGSGSSGSGSAQIHRVLPRKSVFLRTAVGVTGQAQVVAANIDTMFICMPPDQNYNLSRLERYISAAWSGGAVPVAVLTKSDLAEDAESRIRELSEVCIGVDIITASNKEEDTKQKLSAYIKPGKTVCFVGSSGVGKSTLINILAGSRVAEVSELGVDGKGRHTTTGREMLLIEGGGIVIDTPGMRELGAETVDFERSFADIIELASECRFGDCSHTVEPGCAVLAAVSSGTLESRRLENYRKLLKEAKYDGLSSKQIEGAKIKEMFGSMDNMKNMRKFVKNKRK